MKVEQIAEILNNTINPEQIGESAVVNNDLSNIVDVGKQILDYTGESKENYDNFVRSLIDKVGKVVFRNEPLTLTAPKIMRDNWEYGAIMQKVRCTLPKADDNELYNLDKYPIMSGAKYPDPFEITKPTIDTKFFTGSATYDVPITIPEDLFNSSFTSAEQVSSLLDMIVNSVHDKRTLCNSALIMRTIDMLIAQKVHSKNNVINLLADYNTINGTSLTSVKAYEDEKFLLYASKTIATYKRYLQEPSMLYNNEGWVNQTTADRLHTIILTQFAKSMQFNLKSNVYHDELVSIGDYDEVTAWQGSGTANEDRAKIDITILNPENEKETVAVQQDGIVAVLFDNRACAVCNTKDRTTSAYNGRGEYTNYWYKWLSKYMVDIGENAVVFVVSDAIPAVVKAKTTIK